MRSADLAQTVHYLIQWPSGSLYWLTSEQWGVMQPMLLFSMCKSAGSVFKSEWTVG